MRESRDQLDFFIRAVHHRHVLLRILENSALGIVVASIFGAVMVSVLLWRGENAWGVLSVALALGAVCGATWAYVRRPSVLAAAAEADGQLRTSDLLATAWTLRDAHADDDPFARTVLAIAAERCSRVRPSEIVFRRLGLWAWGGVALAVGFVVTLAAMSSSTSRSGALGASENLQTFAQSPSARQAGRPIVDLAAEGSPLQRRVERSPGEEPDRSNSPDLTPSEISKTDRVTANDPSRRSNGASDFPGNGQNESRSHSLTNPIEASVQPRDVARPSASNASAAGGVGRPSNNQTSGAPAPSGGVTSDKRAEPAPWQSAAWPSAVDMARRDVSAGRVPDDARDLVRGYFDLR